MNEYLELMPVTTFSKKLTLVCLFIYFPRCVRSTDFCYECLPPLVYRYARAERVKFDNFFAALQKVNILSEETKSDIDLAKWAFNVVYTRSWGTNDEKAIVPMADMVRVVYAK